MRGALDEVAARAGAQCLDDHVVVLEHRHDDDADVRRGRRELAGGVDAAEAGHREVHQDDVDLQRERGVDAGCAVGRRRR